MSKNKKALKFNELQGFLSLAVRTGLEPATPCVTGRYSNQLNYRTKPALALAQMRTQI
jgi:hypothetical protein